MRRESINHAHVFIEVKTALEQECRILDLSTESRAQLAVKARNVYMGITREMLGDDFRLAECAFYINRDHSSIIHGLYEFDAEVDAPNQVQFWIYKNTVSRLKYDSRRLTMMKTGTLRDTCANPYRYKINANEEHKIV